MTAKALVLLAAIAALFGGWAVITVEDLPDYLVAGQPVSLTFTVRQHGVRPLEAVAPTVEARSGAGRSTGPSRRPSWNRRGGGFVLLVGNPTADPPAQLARWPAGDGQPLAGPSRAQVGTGGRPLPTTRPHRPSALRVGQVPDRC